MSNFYLLLIMVVILVSIAAMFYKNSTTRVVRFLLMGFVFVAAAGVVYSTESYKGWPTEETITKGQLKGVEISYPNVNSNGHIYLWAYAESNVNTTHWYGNFLYRFQEVAPRNYVLPYSKKAAKKYAQAKQSIENGDIVTIESDTGKGKDAGSLAGVGAASKNGKEGSLSDEDTGSGASADKGDDSGPNDLYTLKTKKADSLLHKN